MQPPKHPLFLPQIPPGSKSFRERDLEVWELHPYPNLSPAQNDPHPGLAAAPAQRDLTSSRMLTSIVPTCPAFSLLWPHARSGLPLNLWPCTSPPPLTTPSHCPEAARREGRGSVGSGDPVSWVVLLLGPRAPRVSSSLCQQGAPGSRTAEAGKDPLPPAVSLVS